MKMHGCWLPVSQWLRGVRVPAQSWTEGFLTLPRICNSHQQQKQQIRLLQSGNLHISDICPKDIRKCLLHVKTGNQKIPPSSDLFSFINCTSLGIMLKNHLLLQCKNSKWLVSSAFCSQDVAVLTLIKS